MMAAPITKPVDRRVRLLAKIRVHYEQGIHSKIPRCCVLAWCKAEITREELPHVSNAGYRPCQKCAWKIRGGSKPVSLAVCSGLPMPMTAEYPWHLCKCGKRGRWWWEERYPIILKQYRRNGGSG